MVFKFVPALEPASFEENPAPDRNGGGVNAATPTLSLCLSGQQKTRFRGGLGTLDESSLLLNVPLVPVLPCVVDKLVHWQYWLSAEHEFIGRQVRDAMRGGVVDHHEMR